MELQSLNISPAKQNRKKITAFILSSLCVVIVIAIIVLTESKSSEQSIVQPRICTSDECNQSASDIKLAMNTNLDPCDDFYRYACDNWISRNQNSTWYDENSAFANVNKNILREAINYFQTPELPNEPKPVKQSRDFYNSCMKQDVRDKYEYGFVFDYFSKLGLPKIPRYFNMTGDKKDIRNYKFDWIKTDAAMNKLLDIQVLVDCDVIENVYNNTKYSIMFSIPKKKLLGYQYLTMSKRHDDLIRLVEDEESSTNLNDLKIAVARLQFMSFVLNTLISKGYENELPLDFNNRLLNAIDAIIEMDGLLSWLRNKEFSKTSLNDIIMLPVNKLQEYTDLKVQKILNIKKPIKLWTPYIESLFSGLNVSLDLDYKHEILIHSSHKDYFAAVAKLLATELDAKIELWFWWKAAANLIIHTTTEAKVTVNKIAQLIESDEVESDEEICAILIKNYMDYAVTYALANKSFLNSTKPKIVEMWQNIRTAFESRVQRVTWMNYATKQLTIEKSQAMIDFIGFPEWLLQEDLLEKYYSGIKINASTYLANLIETTKFGRRLKLERLNLKNNKSWTISPLEVNAYNYVLGNAITIPMGIIRYPFYNRGLDVLNYASLGFILGHELTHGFDITGRKFDKYGNINEWWSASTVFQFALQTICFVKQYNSFYIPEIDAYIDGLTTASENLADNGGIHHAFLAYQNIKKNEEEELKLPGLEQFTSEQLFFLAYANVWCDKEDVNNLKDSSKESHCPNKYRVLGTLKNSHDFAITFNCPVGSNMNPGEKGRCKVW